MNSDTLRLDGLHQLRKELMNHPLFMDCKIHSIENHDLFLHFSTPLSMEMIRYYSKRIHEIELPTILLGKIESPLEVADYTELMENWSSLFLAGNWHKNFQLWLRSTPGPFLQVKELTITNLLEIVEPADLLLLRDTFPNLKLLRYGRKSSIDPVKKIFPAKILESFYC